MECDSVKAVSLRFWFPTVFPIPPALSDPGLSDYLYPLHVWLSPYPSSTKEGEKHLLWAM